MLLCCLAGDRRAPLGLQFSGTGQPTFDRDKPLAVHISLEKVGPLFTPNSRLLAEELADFGEGIVKKADQNPAVTIEVFGSDCFSEPPATFHHPTERRRPVSLDPVRHV